MTHDMRVYHALLARKSVHAPSQAYTETLVPARIHTKVHEHGALVFVVVLHDDHSSCLSLPTMHSIPGHYRLHAPPSAMPNHHSRLFCESLHK